MQFRQFLEDVAGGGAYLPSDWTGSEQNPTLGQMGHSNFLPSTDMTIPSVTRTAKIQFIERHKNPITIMLSDGTRMYLTWDQYKRIAGEPAVGKQMTVVFQRNPEDSSEQASKIQSITVT